MTTTIKFDLETRILLERLAEALERIAKGVGQPHWTCPVCNSANPQQHAVNCSYINNQMQ